MYVSIAYLSIMDFFFLNLFFNFPRKYILVQVLYFQADRNLE